MEVEFPPVPPPLERPDVSGKHPISPGKEVQEGVRRGKEEFLSKDSAEGRGAGISLCRVRLRDQQNELAHRGHDQRRLLLYKESSDQKEQRLARQRRSDP